MIGGRPRAGLDEFLALAALAALLAAGLAWGLHPQWSWDVDNTAPGSVLRAIAARFGPEWSSSYGPVPYAVMAVPMVPLLAFFKLTGELGSPSSAYPWGFAHPLVSVNALTLAARSMTALLALLVAVMAVREAARDGVRRAGFAALLLAGSATFLYYGRTSNVDLHYLFWLWAGFHVAERAASFRGLALGAACAVLAVCSKEQAGPLAAVAVLLAFVRAWRGVSARATGPLARGPAAAIAVGLVALLTYAAAWRLPAGLPGWREHHHFLFEEATYPRTFPATLEGFAQLAMRAASLAPLALGWALLAAVAAAIALRVSWRGVGVRAAACALYLVAFLGGIGYVYPRFLLPLLLVAVPIGARGLDALAARGLAGRAGAVAILLLTLLGGPSLVWTQARDPRLALERWLAPRVAAGARVEVAGNPHFQARVNDEQLVRAKLEDLQRSPRPPREAVVLTSSLDEAGFEADAVVGPTWWAPLTEGGAYEAPVVFEPPVTARFTHGLPVAPRVRAWVRRQP